MALSLKDIETLFDTRGGEQYSGESVTQLEHALQTAQRAEVAGAWDDLAKEPGRITPALGHFMTRVRRCMAS